MGKKNNQLKQLANLAKQRLLNKNYNDTVTDKFLPNRASAYFLENAKAMKKLTAKTEFVSISLADEPEFIRQVVEILRNNELGSLGYLTDKNYYKTLKEDEKQLYMLRLSEKFNRVKQAYENNTLPTEFIA